MNRKEKKYVPKIKLATVLYQWTKDGKSPFLQLLACPQTKNENSNFNYDAAEVMLEPSTF